MNKTELIDDLKSREFVLKLIGDLILMNDDPITEIKTYQQNYIESVGLAARTRFVMIHVLDEGKAEEAAYYKDNEVARSIPVIQTEDDPSLQLP